MELVFPVEVVLTGAGMCRRALSCPMLGCFRLMRTKLDVVSCALVRCWDWLMDCTVRSGIESLFNAGALSSLVGWISVGSAGSRLVGLG